MTPIKQTQHGKPMIQPISAFYHTVNTQLALEIGLNESMVLLQIAFWIKCAPDENYRDGQWWTYQSIRDLHEKSFAFLSLSTVARTLNKLVNLGYLVEANYNKNSYDKTRWFALNEAKLAELTSIKIIMRDDISILQNESSMCQIDTPIIQNDTGGVCQNDTTIPVTKYKNKNIKTLEPKNQPTVAEQHSPIAPNGGGQLGDKITTSTPEPEVVVVQTPEPTNAKQKPKTKEQPEKTEDRVFNGIALLCFGLDIKALTEDDRVNLKKESGRIAKISTWLKKKGVTAEELWLFGKWYQQMYTKISMPRDLKKFQEHWMLYVQSGGKVTVQAEPETVAPVKFFDIKNDPILSRVVTAENAAVL